MPSPATPHTRATPPRNHWTHLDGIRSLAIELVVIFHVFVGKVSSGVDVFLFVGGLLPLSSQVKNVAGPDGRNPLRSLTRIPRRLLPALVPVVGASTIGVLVCRGWNQLTDQYVRTLSHELERQMYPAEQ